ncbi:MAG: hypothetical protein CL596_05375 [Alteromonas sp.]|nr:hypothetical protein [Alteromonas sp.]|tara:strand:+ start:5516 stop:6202 length:687 start_codon:yes stop_codon:yes gene_type:complete
MALPITQQLIERSIFKAIKEIIVKEGYFPDVDNYSIDNPEPAIAESEQKRLKHDVKIIAAEKGYAVELFSNGTQEDRGQIKPPRIVIESESFLPGELGIDTTKTFEKKENGNYKAIDNSFLTQLSDYYFYIRLISNSVEQERVLNSIIISSIPRRGYLKWADQAILNPHSNIMIQYLSHTETNWDQGIKEKSFRYEIKDIMEIGPKEIPGEIPAIKNLSINDLEIEIK